LSGCEHSGDGWLERRDLADVLRPWLTEIGRTYVPVMLANAKALNDGEKEVRTTVDGQPWVQQAFPYQGRCVAELRARYARLEPADRRVVDDLLEGTGCRALFA